MVSFERVRSSSFVWTVKVRPSMSAAQVIKTEHKTYTCSRYKEVITLKFGEVVIAVASLVVIIALVSVPLSLVLSQL